MPRPDAVLVTGASGGLGGALALAFSTEGRAVALHFHTGKERAWALRERIRGLGGEAEAFAADLSRPEGCAQLADDVCRWAGGGLAGLVHAAGGARDAPLISLSEVDWDGVVAVHLSSPFRLLCRGVVATGGFVVLIGSGAIAGRAGQAAYAAAKAGLGGLTRALARQLGSDGIRINTVVPGPLDTPMWRRLSPLQRKRILAANALERINTVEEVARFVIALSTMQATSGQVLAIGSRVGGA